MTGRPEQAERVERVSTLELFFDLVFVFTITQLTAVLSDLSRRQDQVLAPETRALLQSVDPHSRQGGWLDHLRVLVQRDAA